MRITLLALVLLFSIRIQAQQNSEFKVQTLAFLKLTGTTKAFDNVITQVGASVPQDQREAYKKEAEATSAALYGKIADIYMAEFTQNEIRELIAFYNSDLGKKLANKQLPLMQKGMAVGQTWGADLQGIAQKYQLFQKK